MEVVEDIVIVGGGIAGLTTALGLHRLGIRSLVLESADSMRTTGFAFMTWSNAWKALDAIGIGESLRQKHHRLQGMKAISTETGSSTELSFIDNGKKEGQEVRCVKRKLLLGTLEKELPSGTIRYSSKVVSIEDAGYSKLIHLSNGTILKTKVLIGCDGVNSVVAKFLGLDKPAFAGRSAMRGYTDFEGSHELEPKFYEYFGNGIKSGFIPCDDHTVYWFFTYTPSPEDKGMEEDPIRMKQYILSNLGNVSKEAKAVMERLSLEGIVGSPLRYRRPWEFFFGNISKGNTCVAGDALHPMTPDLGQGGCSALEDGVTLARCLAEALKRKPGGKEAEDKVEENEYKRIKMGLERYANERRLRSFALVSTAFMIGFIQQSDGKMINFIRDKYLGGYLAWLLFKRASFDCGKLE